ncbi:hypothetical protein E5675_19025 [Sphingopyxis sp. PAMC25046]|uniref:hypothetical protein n=1 Tax=Sphingopyxis sp. PAMC25046 TaxID=2565556 RepID=UPI00109DEAA1|nr:hypothetical protein [Sphingopyxis sp. PAMC25046]QCB56316.1 hypothetical protein E5675_19025 [Sphingopyxis sp. PAMC25046]
MTDDKMAAEYENVLTIRTRISALLGDYAAPERAERDTKLPAKARAIRRRVKKLLRRPRGARKVA